MSFERSVDVTQTANNKLHQRALYAAACGSVALLAVLTGCDSEPTKTPTKTSVFDKDNDGILDSQDRYPNIPDAPDADGDGKLNGDDLLFPYDATNGGIDTPTLPKTKTVPVPVPVPAPAPNNTQPCIRHTLPDSDGDGIPDHCDSFYGGLPDADNDGLADKFDTYPNTADRDNDGILDSSDSDPNYDQERAQEKRDQEKRDAERRENARLEQQRLEQQRLEQQRQRDRDGY